MRLQWIENAGKVWHKLYSMRGAIATTLLSSAGLGFEAMPHAWRDAFPNWALFALGGATVATSAFTGLARMIEQPSLKADPKFTVRQPDDDNAEHA